MKCCSISPIAGRPTTARSRAIIERRHRRVRPLARLPFLSDFTVAMRGGQIKTGSASRGERIAKYN